MDILLTTILSSTLLLSTAVATPAANAEHISFTRVLPEKDYVGYIVERENTLAEIAQKAYGSDEYWTTLWNDNAWIIDPELVTKDAVLKVRLTKPSEPIELVTVLVERNNTVINQKNEVYLKQISLQSIVSAQPTVVPTQAAPVTAPSVPGAISDEAITYLGNCEAGMDPAKNTGNGYYGAFQFSSSTWNNLNTGYARADLAPIEVQKAAVQQLLAKSSIHNQFPGCAKKMRSAGLI